MARSSGLLLNHIQKIVSWTINFSEVKNFNLGLLVKPGLHLSDKRPNRNSPYSLHAKQYPSLSLLNTYIRVFVNVKTQDGRKELMMGRGRNKQKRIKKK
jgi:hypothetical protein